VLRLKRNAVGEIAIAQQQSNWMGPSRLAAISAAMIASGLAVDS